MVKYLPTKVMSVIGLGLFLTGCVGESSVSYQGSVLEGTASGHSFDSAPNPERARGIAGATVELCVDVCQGHTILTRPDGTFPEIEQVFGGTVGHDAHITVRASAPDGRVVTYEATYEKTSDPTYANRAGSTPVYLNLRVAPR